MPDFLDMIIEGNILTMSDSLPRVEAVGVSNGKIAMTGDFTEVAKNVGKNTQYLALKDKTVIPGFIETHMHPTQVGNVLLNVDLAAATSISDILQNLEEKKNITPAGESILGLNFNYDIVKEHRLPTLQELDKLSSAHPIMVLVYDVHSAMLNTPMLEKIGLPDDTTGLIKDENGLPTGLIEDPAIALLLQKLLPENENDIITAVDAAVNEALSVGITTLHMKEPLHNLKAIIKNEQSLPIRIKPLIISRSPNHRERITLYEAMKLFTVNAARIGFEEQLKGTIEAGKLADLTVLSDNPYSVEPEEVGDIKVEMTIVGGQHRV